MEDRDAHSHSNKKFSIKQSKWGLGLLISIPVLISVLYFGNTAASAIMAVFTFMAIYEVHKNIAPNMQMEDHYKRWVTIFAGFIIGIPIFFAYRMLDILGVKWLLFIAFNAYLTDAGSYAFGSFLSKRFKMTKIVPRISPNKTWGGALSGILTSFLFCYFFLKAWLIKDGLVAIDNGNLAILIIVGSTGAVIGDLCGSATKRLANIKDSSESLGSHGGFFDKLSSLVMCLYLYMFFFIFANIKTAILPIKLNLF